MQGHSDRLRKQGNVKVLTSCIDAIVIILLSPALLASHQSRAAAVRYRVQNRTNVATCACRIDSVFECSLLGTMQELPLFVLQDDKKKKDAACCTQKVWPAQKWRVASGARLKKVGGERGALELPLAASSSVCS